MAKPTYRIKFNGIQDPPRSGLSVEPPTHPHISGKPPHTDRQLLTPPCGEMPRPLPCLSTLWTLGLSRGNSPASFPSTLELRPSVPVNKSPGRVSNTEWRRYDKTCLLPWSMSQHIPRTSPLQVLNNMLTGQVSDQTGGRVSSAPHIGKMHLGLQAAQACFSACRLRKVTGVV